jgi:hypothetical protein
MIIFKTFEELFGFIPFGLTLPPQERRANANPACPPFERAGSLLDSRKRKDIKKERKKWQDQDIQRASFPPCFC